MLTIDDRKTWFLAGAPAAARLRMRPDASVRPIVDGAWWPRSRDPVTEATALITALDSRYPHVTDVMLNAPAWDSHPRRIRIAGGVVRLGWFASLDACLLIVITRDDQRIDLLVVSPDTSRAVADAAMDMAVDGAPTLQAAAIVAAVSTHPPGRSVPMPAGKEQRRD